jgi:pilus assembly protein CpaC
MDRRRSSISQTPSAPLQTCSFTNARILATCLLLCFVGSLSAQQVPTLPAVAPRTLGTFELSPAISPPPLPTVSELVAPASSADAVLEIYLGQARTLTLKKPISDGKEVGVIAIADPTIADFEVLPNPRMIRLLGKRAGLTDLSIILSDETTLTLQVLVKHDLDLLRAEIRQRFPDALVQVSQVRENIVLEGQVRTAQIASQIVAIAESWVPRSGSTGRGARGSTGSSNTQRMEDYEQRANQNTDTDGQELRNESAAIEIGDRGSTTAPASNGTVINLMRIPGTQQIMLQVRVAELNRTGMREVGADWIFAGDNGNVLGTNISGNVVNAKGTSTGAGLSSAGTGNALGTSSTAFGIFPSANFDVLLRVLRKNALLSILAEPNLVAMSGHEASFLAGGQFPVPVVSGIGGQVSIQYKDFGVQLRFTPTIMDEETIRLNVAPEVSTIDDSLGTTLVPGGVPTPGINTRKVNTTVEMREGETLALAGLLEVAIDAQTTRIPGLGDLPYLGPFFSNTTHQRVEKELLVLVTPFFIAASPNSEEFLLPGQDIVEPNDLEFYFLSRIEGKTGRSFHTTQSWEDPWNCVDRLKLERQCLHGPVGFSR